MYNNNNNNYARRGPYSNTNASYYNRPSSGYGTYNQNSSNRYGSSGMGGMGGMGGGAMSPYSSSGPMGGYGYNDNYYGSGGGYHSGGGGGIGGGYYPNNNNYQYDDHSMRYQNQYQYDSHFDDPYRRTTTTHRYAAPSSTTSSSSLSNLTAKQDVKRIRYLLLLLSGILTWLGGFVFWRVWKRFLRPLFFSDSNSRNSGQSGEDVIGSMATVAGTTTRTIDLKKNKKLLEQYEQFMDRNDMNNNNNKFNMGSNEYLDDNDLDDLLQVIQDQYDREDDLKRKNHQKQRKMSKQSLVHKLKRGMIVHQKQLELNVAYLKRIEHMSNEELKQEYERLYKEKTANQSTDLNRENPVEERMDDSKNIIFDYLRRTMAKNMANDELQHGENENENAIQSPFVENNELSMVDKDVNGSSFIREYIEREKNFVSKCQRILQSLYVSAHDDEKKDINTKESTELNDVMSEQFDNDPVIFNDRTRNMDDDDEAVVLANR